MIAESAGLSSSQPSSRPVSSSDEPTRRSAAEEMSRVGVLVLTDRSQLPLGRSLQATVAAVVSAGVTHVVLRELDLSAEERAGLAEEFVAVGATVIAARRAVPGCRGVHLSSDQGAGSSRDAAEPPRPVRGSAAEPSVRRHPVVNRPAPIGRSCHSADEVRRAAAEGASYATLGPYAATPSKPGYGPPLAPLEYADLPIPTFALGGITPDNAAAAVAAGATGVAVMGAVMRAPDPGATAAALLEAIR